MQIFSRVALAAVLFFAAISAKADGLSGSVTPQLGGGIGGFDGGLTGGGGAGGGTGNDLLVNTSLPMFSQGTTPILVQ